MHEVLVSDHIDIDSIYKPAFQTAQTRVVAPYQFIHSDLHAINYFLHPSYVLPTSQN